MASIATAPSPTEKRWNARNAKKAAQEAAEKNTGESKTTAAAPGTTAPDKEVVMAAVYKDGWALRNASDELKNDKEVVMIAVAQNGRALDYASKKLKEDREVVMRAVAQCGRVLEYASNELKADKEVVMIAVAQYGRALEYASDEMRSDKEVATAAVAQNGRALEFASDGLKGDKEVVMAQNGWALEFASDGLKGDKEFIMATVLQNGDALYYASDELKNDKEVVMAVVAQDGRALCYASDELKNDKEVVMAAVSQDGDALQYASEELKNDEEVATAAVMQGERAMEYVSNALKPVVLKERINKLEGEGIIVVELQGVDQLSSFGFDMNEGEESTKDAVDKLTKAGTNVEFYTLNWYAAMGGEERDWNNPELEPPHHDVPVEEKAAYIDALIHPLGVAADMDQLRIILSTWFINIPVALVYSRDKQDNVHLSLVASAGDAGGRWETYQMLPSKDDVLKCINSELVRCAMSSESKTTAAAPDTTAPAEKSCNCGAPGMQNCEACSAYVCEKNDCGRDHCFSQESRGETFWCDACHKKNDSAPSCDYCSATEMEDSEYSLVKCSKRGCKKHVPSNPGDGCCEAGYNEHYFCGECENRYCQKHAVKCCSDC